MMCRRAFTSKPCPPASLKISDRSEPSSLICSLRFSIRLTIDFNCSLLLCPGCSLMCVLCGCGDRNAVETLAKHQGHAVDQDVTHLIRANLDGRDVFRAKGLDIENVATWVRRGHISKTRNGHAALLSRLIWRVTISFKAASSSPRRIDRL